MISPIAAGQCKSIAIRADVFPGFLIVTFSKKHNVHNILLLHFQ